MSVESYLRAIPKAELHVHIEGSVNLPALIELARRNDVKLPVSSDQALRDWFTFQSFPHFMEVYRAIIGSLRTVEDYELIVVNLGAELARQNCRYAEATFSPSSHDFSGIPTKTWLDGITRGRQRVRDEFGVELNWIFDIPRHVLGAAGDARADYTVEAAIAAMDAGVVALGLGGSEAGFLPDRWEPWFDRARAAGLRSDPHAGEHGGPESIWGAIHRLGADRIGHGARSIEDDALVAYLAEHRIPVELNMTSNLLTGICATYQDHAVRRLHDAGVVITVNSDDPPIFGTSLNDEHLALYNEIGLTVEEIDEIALNAVRSSFLPDERKSAMEAQYRTEMQALKLIHLG